MSETTTANPYRKGDRVRMTATAQRMFPQYGRRRVDYTAGTVAHRPQHPGAVAVTWDGLKGTANYFSTADLELIPAAKPGLIPRERS